MPLITEAELKKQIKSRSFSPVYVIYGSEQMYVKEYTKKLVEAARVSSRVISTSIPSAAR